MFGKSLLSSLFLTAALAAPAMAEDFRLSSTTIAEGAQLKPSQVFAGFGCTGQNQSPQLSWSGAPAGTKSFAITLRSGCADRLRLVALECREHSGLGKGNQAGRQHHRRHARRRA